MVRLLVLASLLMAAPAAAADCPAGMLPIPGGKVTIGSDRGDADERPVHTRTLAPYCLDRTEVTVAAYARCVSAGACTPAGLTVKFAQFGDADVRQKSQFCNSNRKDRQDHPVNCVDWGQADAYCRFAGARLPTEAEWEHAARGDDGRDYPWGADPPTPERLNACDSDCLEVLQRIGIPDWESLSPDADGAGSTAPVGRYPKGASPYGVLDLAGNVWEWTADWYGPYDKGAPARGRVRVTRGGGWLDGNADHLRATVRDTDDPADRLAGLGFRCAASR
jgi:formylglycine-generating enzyme required for sulfatase activity